MAGLRQGRGPWQLRTLDITSASTFSTGDAVGIGTARNVSVYSGGAGNFLGIATHDSSNSLPAGKGVFLVPTGPGCTMFCDVPTGVAQSVASFGETLGLYRVGGKTSYITASYTSDAGRPLIAEGPINSANSTIEVGIKLNAVVYGSAVSVLGL